MARSVDGAGDAPFRRAASAFERGEIGSGRGRDERKSRDDARHVVREHGTRPAGVAALLLLP
jgi:hypothetical protein